jgi:hypothetical protein
MANLHLGQLAKVVGFDQKDVILTAEKMLPYIDNEQSVGMDDDVENDSDNDDNDDDNDNDDDDDDDYDDDDSDGDNDFFN